MRNHEAKCRWLQSGGVPVAFRAYAAIGSIDGPTKADPIGYCALWGDGEYAALTYNEADADLVRATLAEANIKIIELMAWQGWSRRQGDLHELLAGWRKQVESYDVPEVMLGIARKTKDGSLVGNLICSAYSSPTDELNRVQAAAIKVSI